MWSSGAPAVHQIPREVNHVGKLGYGVVQSVPTNSCAHLVPRCIQEINQCSSPWWQRLVSAVDVECPNPTFARRRWLHWFSISEDLPIASLRSQGLEPK